MRVVNLTDPPPVIARSVLAGARHRMHNGGFLKMIAARVGDAAQGEKFCASGGKVMVITAARLREFEKIAEPLYAKLERDSVSGKVLAEIRALKSTAGAPPAVTPCGK